MPLTAPTLATYVPEESDKRSCMPPWWCVTGYVGAMPIQGYYWTFTIQHALLAPSHCTFHLHIFLKYPPTPHTQDHLPNFTYPPILPHVTLTVAHGLTIIKFPSKIYYKWLIDIEDGTLLRSVVTTRTFLHNIQGTEQSGVVQYMCRLCTNSSTLSQEYTHIAACSCSAS